MGIKMKEKIKAWIEYEYQSMVKHGSNPREAMTRAYGVIMFGLNSALDEWDDELADWWSDEMLPKFRKLGA